MGSNEMIRLFILIFCFLMLAVTSTAGEADVLSVDIRLGADGAYTIFVEVEHADDGWDHYADAWEVVAPDGTVLATRILAHPHVNEQPFIRSLSGVEIPDDIQEVRVRGRDLVHEYGGKEISVPVPR
ncbi:MAG: hypothetical protein AAF683_03285 [Pseudomonadota bacterium]